ncbi:MAG: TfoX/Sxy family DNA transformation protein [Sedimentisphaerales bacterium]|nr:TfoX/Sxy family DNA transformation protein [Sedimentisphaerales bacterium]
MTSKSDRLESLTNIGKVTAEKLRAIGIKTRQQFLQRDPYEIYAELLVKVDPSLCRCALAGLVGAAKNRKWHTVTKQAAKEFQRRYPDHAWANNC